MRGAGLDRTYYFEKRYDATQNTVIGLGKNLRSGLAFLCFDAQMGRTEVRLARAPFPSHTFPSHGTMFTGLWPNLHRIAGNAYVKRDGSFQWKPATGKGCRTARRCKGIGRQTVG